MLQAVITSRQIFCERRGDLPYGERVMMASSGGKIMFPFRVQRGGPPLFKWLPNLTASLLLCCGEYKSNLLLEGANFLVLLNCWRIFNSTPPWTHKRLLNYTEMLSPSGVLASATLRFPTQPTSSEEFKDLNVYFSAWTNVLNLLLTLKL